MEDKKQVPEDVENSADPSNIVPIEESSENVEDNSETAALEPLSNRTDNVEPMFPQDVNRAESVSKAFNETSCVATAGTSPKSSLHHESKSDMAETMWSAVDHRLRQRNAEVIDSSQMGQHENVSTFSEYGYPLNKDDGSATPVTRSERGLPANLETSCFKDSQDVVSGSGYTFKSQEKQTGINDDKTASCQERNRKISSESSNGIKESLSSSSERDIPSTSRPNFGPEMEAVENLFTDQLNLNEHSVFRGSTTSLSTASNEISGLSQRESTDIQRSQIESTSNDDSQMDFLPSIESLDSPKNVGKRKRKDANPLIILSPPSDSSNLCIDKNSPDLEEQNSPLQMDDTEVKSLELSDSDVFYDYQGSKEDSTNKNSTKPKKSSIQRKRKIGRFETREFEDMEMASCSYQTHPIESQDKITSSDTDVACDSEYMKILEQTGESPDVKDLKKQIKRENFLKTRQHLRSNSGSQPRRSSASSRAWSINSFDKDLPEDISPRKQELSEFHSSSSEENSRTTTPKKQRVRKKHIEHGPRDSDFIKTNSELVRKAESLSSSEDALPPLKRLKKYDTVEDLSKEVNSTAGASSLSQESRAPGTSANLRKSRSPRKLRNLKKPRTPKKQVSQPKCNKRNASGTENTDAETNGKEKKGHKRSKSND